ncbi:TonB-dependent receptor [Novosphingobium pokkalii]|uniref:TonB-dependent receptor n=1 Tax=Novosphingobium pokkalii TaxID=1770194 RepID=A0ABV7V4T1_9SPHN|nr:TonB-dependent receptor [Novosphingobium pokkalii]GHD00637.1 TonB-dependent receptor [Novosphingobium pokkalii]
MFAPFRSVSTLALAVAGLSAIPAAAQGMIVPAAVTVHVPAQAVADAVHQFAAQAHVQIVVSGSIARGHRSVAVDGTMDVSAALARMLGQTGLVARSTGPGVFVIVAEKGALAPAAAQAEPGAQAPEGSIIVTGVREAQEQAAAEKRDALNVTETLRANDVGKLPDQNVAEAIKRLPGLSVANDQGEGRYAIVRGIDPGLLNVTLNGQTLPAPEPDGRQVKLDDLPSAMIQAVTVTKSVLPNQDANAIAGEVAIRTRTAFDSKAPFTFDARGAIGRYSLNHKTAWEADGTVGGRFGADEQFGAVVSVNYSKRNIESENYQGSSNWANGLPDGNGIRDYNLTRTRLGVVGNFDWHPSPTAKIYLRTSYSEYKDNETRDQNRLAITNATTMAATATVLVRRRIENDNTKSATLGGEFSDVAGGTLSVSGGWTRAEKKDPLRSEFTYSTAKGGVTTTYNGGTYPYTLAATTDIFNTPSAFTFSKVNFETRHAAEQIWQGRIDYSHPLGGDSTFAVGAKLLSRDKTDDHDRLDYKTTGKIGKTGGALGDVDYVGDTSFMGGQFAMGSRIDYASAKAWFDANPTQYALDASGTLSDSLSSDYRVKEDIVAAYAMATIKTGALTLVPGVRMEHTVDKAFAKIVNAASTLTDGYNSYGRAAYTDFFPGLTARIDAARGLLLRGAVTTSIGRPNYPDLAPYVIADTSGTIPAVSIGNADLQPYRAINYDAGVEYYPAPGAILSAGYFHKDIRNPIYSFGQTETGVTLGGTYYPSAQVTQPINVDREQLSGVEFNVQYQFTRLPGLLAGFGISANYTHVWGDAHGVQVRDGAIPLAYQSRDVGNVQVFYEKYGLSARVAFNYRSAYLDTLGSSAATDQYTDGNAQLDVHVAYQIKPQFTVFGDATNLTDAPWRRYEGIKSQLIEREHYGSMVRGGVQVHF